MAINQLRYYLGPLGYLQALPPMLGGQTFPEAPIHIPSALHTSLAGRVTQDRMGVPKRSWALVWENLTESDRLLIDAAIYGSAGLPLRLIDPRSTNRLPADVSAGGGLSLGTSAFGSTATITDAFGRTVAAGGWGSADTGQAYSTSGTASNFSVGSGVGSISVPTNNTPQFAYLSTVSLKNPEVLCDVAVLPFVNVTGAPIYPLNLLVRGQSTTRFYRAFLSIETDQSVKLGLLYNNAGNTTLVAQATVVGLAHVGSNVLRMRFKVTDQLLQIRVWDAASTEPTVWHVSYLDTANSITVAGWVGIYVDCATGNTNTKPVVFNIDNLSITGTPPLSYLAGSVPTSLAGILAGAQNWTGLFLDNRLTAVSEKMPVLSGSSYLFSVHATGTAQFKMMARPFDVSGVEQTLASSSTQTATGTYQRFSWTWTPSAGQVSAYFGLVAQGAGNIQTTGWHVGVDRPALDPWSFGVGCPTVVVDADVPASYWRAKYHRLRVTLREV